MRTLLLLLWCSSVFAGSVAKDGVHARATLISQMDSVEPGAKFRIGLRFLIDPEWHVYWKNPGDSGTPPSIKMDLPPEVSVGEIAWPLPQKIPVAHLMNFGYEKEVLLAMPAEVQSDVKPGTKLRLTGKADWLVCKEACIPGSAEVSVTIAVGKSMPSRWAKLFAETETKIPRVTSQGRVVAKANAEHLYLELAGLKPRDNELSFFPWNDSEIANAAPQLVERRGDVTRVQIDWDAARHPKLEKIEGLLVSSKGWESDSRAAPSAIWITAPLTSPTLETELTMANANQLWQNLLLAFLGGIILNLMPCVFPVLSIKILNFVQQAGHSKNKLRAHGWFFTLGVMVSFWVLSGALIGLRLGGEKLGWGFQLQSPYFLLGVIVLFFTMSLNFLGVFEIGNRMMGVGAELSGKVGLSGSFFSGVLATIVATPCTAPMMGTAVGFALAQPPLISLIIFTSLGAGMAFPYLVLSYSPKLLKLLPRPGAWMQTLREGMAFPLMATVVWLVWVFGQQTGLDGVLYVLASILALGFAIWVITRHAKTAQGKIFQKIFGLVTLLFAVWVGVTAAGFRNQAKASAAGETAETYPMKWEKFSTTKVKELHAAGKPVFVDYTAAWCVSCQVNEKVVFSSEAVRRRFHELGIVAMKADWTNGDDEITDSLASFGRSGVPFYLLYSKNPSQPPTPLPEVLTPDIVLTALSKI